MSGKAAITKFQQLYGHISVPWLTVKTKVMNEKAKRRRLIGTALKRHTVSTK